jgi:hypothetical protein
MEERMSPGFLAALFTIQAIAAGFCAAMYMERRHNGFIGLALLWSAIAVFTFKVFLDRLLP